MVDFIDTHRSEFGVEPICALLPIAPSSYYDAKSRPVSARARRHAAMTAVLVALWAANYRVYGARKLWLAARRAGHEIGRDQVAALMRAAGSAGSPAAGGRAPPCATLGRSAPAISSTGTSPRGRRTGCGSPT